MNPVLITGANGQLGTAIRNLKDQYPDLLLTFRDKDSLDITNKEEVEAVLSNGGFKYCINCAAYTNVEQAELNPEAAYSVNETGTGIIAAACYAYDVVLIYPSTDYVFDGEKSNPYTVDDKPNPINEYGKSKLAGEKKIMKLMDRYFIIRTSWLYSHYGQNFYTTILNKAKEQETLHITSAQTGCPTNAENLAKYILDIISRASKSYGIHHFTDGVAMTWYDFALEILRQNGLEDQVEVVEVENYRTFAKRPRNSVLK